MPDPAAGLGLPPLRDRPRITVVMPVRNEAGFIEQSLGAVLAQERRPDQVVVVDGESDDDTARSAERLLAASGVDHAVLTNPRHIVPVSLNLALAAATGDVIVRVDGHCIIEPDYLERCVAALHETGAECVGGPMRTVGMTPSATAIAVAQSSRFGVGGVAFRTSEDARFVDTLAFGAYRREVFDRIGRFDESLVRNQDDEFNLRLIRSGGRIWMDPAIRSTYSSRGTLRQLFRQYYQYGYFKVRVMQKHRTVPAIRHLVPAAFVAALASAVALAVVGRRRWPLGALLGTYVTATGWSAVKAADQTSVSPGPVAAAVVTMHLAYGLGFWRGVVPVDPAAVPMSRSRP